MAKSRDFLMKVFSGEEDLEIIMGVDSLPEPPALPWKAMQSQYFKHNPVMIKVDADTGRVDANDACQFLLDLEVAGKCLKQQLDCSLKPLKFKFKFKVFGLV